MHEVYHVGHEVEVRLALACGLLYAAVKVNGEHALRTCRHASGTERVAETVVLYLVAQAAARSQRIGVVAHVCKERVSFGVHFGSEVGVLLVYHVAVFCEQRHRLDRESEHGLCAFLVEPLHEAFLEPAYGVPVGLRAVGVVELAEYALEIIFVVVGNVPEYGLEVTCAGRLVDGVDYLFEAVGNDFVEGAVAFRQVYYLVGALVEVLAVLLCYEVGHIHKEFRRCARAAQHARHDEYHVDEHSAEGL